MSEILLSSEPVMENKKSAFMEAFEGQESQIASRSEGDWVKPIRKSGIAKFRELGFPTLRDEDWRFTPLAALQELPFEPVGLPVRGDWELPDTGSWPLADWEEGSLWVFVDGHFAPGLSRGRSPEEGVTIEPLSHALRQADSWVAAHLSVPSQDFSHAFTCLNTAFFQDGLAIRVEKNRVAKTPIHIVHLATGQAKGAWVQPRHVVVAEEGSELTFVQSYLGVGNQAGVTNSMDLVFVEENARVEQIQLQDQPLHHFHVGHLYAHLSRNSRFRSHSIATGSALARNNIRMALQGEGGEGILNGLFLARERQLLDHHMIVDHAKPHCESHEYFNGILDHQSKGVFHGRILVRQDAQKTDAKQTNKNILLSDQATIDTKPQLEIYADDVKCTHGATIGQMNDEAIFYLRARGIPLERARRMLIHAFTGEITDRILCLPVRERIDEWLWNRLEQYHLTQATQEIEGE